MTDIKLDSKLLEDVAESLAPHADAMFKDRAGHWMAVVEFAHVERTQPGGEGDKPQSVKIRVVGVEVAGSDVAEERLREAQQQLYQRRTSPQTLDEELHGADYRASDILRNGSGLLTTP